MNTWLSFLKRSTKKFWEYLHKPSLVEAWKQKRKDEEYLQKQIASLQEECSELEREADDNVYGLERLTMFTVAYQSDKERRHREDHRRALDIAYNYIFENRKRFEHSVPEHLEEYFAARRELEKYQQFEE